VDKTIEEKLRAFFKQGTAKTHRKGDVIIQAGQEPDGVSLLVEGSVEQYDITAAGNKVTVNIFRPPAFFPMSWAINKTPNGFFFAAVTDVKLRQVDASVATSFLQSNPDVMYDLLSRVYKGTDALLRRLVLAAGGVATAKLIFELLLEAYRFGEPTRGNMTFINIKQSQLADRSGLARETVSREIHKLEQEGLVIRAQHGIEVKVPELEQRLDLVV
jgi:CRP/FNR family cyclic AMP-dependent transcriptional regulator